MTYLPWFPEAGSYVKYFDSSKKEYRFRKLLWKRSPLVYPYRLPAIAAGSKGDPVTFTEINPSETKKHIYLTYLGVKPGFLYYLYHPYDIKTLKWDEDILKIDEDLVANITYENSPYEFPTRTLGIEHDRYPAIEAKNISGKTQCPEVIWIAALYVVKEHGELSAEELGRLRSGALKSHPWDFGGEL